MRAWLCDCVCEPLYGYVRGIFTRCALPVWVSCACGGDGRGQNNTQHTHTPHVCLESHNQHSARWAHRGTLQKERVLQTTRDRERERERGEGGVRCAVCVSVSVVCIRAARARNPLQCGGNFVLSPLVHDGRRQSLTEHCVVHIVIYDSFTKFFEHFPLLIWKIFV